MNVLSNAELVSKIREICAEKGPRKFAVAFWGADIPAQLFPGGTEGVEIILDVSMQCTTKKALVALGVPAAENIWVCEGMHTKLYIGGAGAVIASANASVNALGTELEGGKLHELGVWIDAQLDRTAYKAACAEFRKLKAKAHPACQSDVDRAPEHMPRLMSWNGKVEDPKSLLDAVVARESAFSNILFVFGDEQVGPGEAKAADEAFHDKQQSILERAGGFTVDQPNRELIAYCGPGQEKNFEKAPMVAMFWISARKIELRTYTQIESVSLRYEGKPARAFYGQRHWGHFKRVGGMSGLGSNQEAVAADRERAVALAGDADAGERWVEYWSSELAQAVALL
jgi:hypothetical protein